MPDIDQLDGFATNVFGVANLIESPINKIERNVDDQAIGEGVGILDLQKTDEELLKLKDEWQSKHDGYYPPIQSRTKLNKLYYQGRQHGAGVYNKHGVSSNLIFEAEETFIPQALSRNPEPVVYSDNSPEGIQASNEIKAMLQYKADTMVLRQKMAVCLRQWSFGFLGIVKHTWSKKDNDFETRPVDPDNCVYDPDAYIDETGRYIGDFFGEKIMIKASKLIEKFPSKKDYIVLKVNGKLGTKVVYTEWWTDEYCFYTFGREVLDKKKNWYFNYDITEINTPEEQMAYNLEPKSVTPGKNHFATPQMPYSFLSIFSDQSQPHDLTNLIEQAIPNQDRILERDYQITRNLATGNNSIIFDDKKFNEVTGRQGAKAIEDGQPILGPVDGVRRLPASPLPTGIMEAQETDKQMLRQIFGTYGITPQQQTSQTTARGQILNQDQDTSRIGGGIGTALEQFGDNIFNWCLQMMYVFYDEPHWGAAIGTDKAIQVVKIINSDINRNFVVSVSPGSMLPKDEVSLQNMASTLWQEQAIDPLTLMRMMPNLFPDPNVSAQLLMAYKTNPIAYAQMIGVQAQQAVQPGGTGISNQEQSLQQPQPQGPPTVAGPPPSSGALSEVPINT